MTSGDATGARPPADPASEGRDMNPPAGPQRRVADAGRMVHPGPRTTPRVQAARTRLVQVQGNLQAGETVLAGVARMFAEAGCRGGTVFLDGVVCDPLVYVLPALSTDGVHAAWYSDTIAPVGTTRILRATASVGQRDGHPFLHCHGLWDTGAGSPAMGHLLPAESRVAEDCRITGVGARDAWFDSRPDPETRFTLFRVSGGGAGDGLLARVAPGEDVATAIEDLCAAHGIADAAVHGLGSIDHIRFADGARVDCLATELRLDGARVERGRAILPIDVVDIDARVHAGTLTHGDNPVGVTLEILIDPLKDRS